MSGAVITGKVIKGLGEGAFFMSMPHYKNEIRKQIGFEAYPGTLNLKANKKEVKSIKDMKPIRIKGYKSKNRAFGGANCYKAKIKDVSGAIILPDLSRHKDIIEFIAPVNLRAKLNLKDNDKVKVELI